MKFAALATLLVLLPAAAFGDQMAADDCAAKLPPNSASIYSASLKKISSGDPVSDIVRKVTRGMVMSGSLSRDDAKPAAEAAGGCLKLLKN